MARGAAAATITERNIFQRMVWPEDQADYSAGFTRYQDFERAITAISRRVDDEKTPFKWRVYWVAALGFLTDSYNLFASNVILPALSFVYWGSPYKTEAVWFNIATLIGSIVGQVAFGVAVDVYGRRSLYGFELMIVVVSTIGLLQCSPGYYDSETNQSTWDITSWLFFWRIVMGIGIGAEYPLSACIAAEWSSRHSRARMMSAVFLMQPLGQLLAYCVGLIALSRLGNDSANMKVNIDKFWRIVVGVGAIPTLTALFARRLIPESWRFTYFVVKNPVKARFDVQDVYHRDSIAVPNETFRQTSPTDQPSDEIGHNVEHPIVARSSSAPVWRPGSQFAWSEFREFLSVYGLRLLGTSLCWFLLDVAFYGLGFNSPGTLAKLWANGPLYFESNASYWQTTTDLQWPNKTVTILEDGVSTTRVIARPEINAVLNNTMQHAIYTTSIAAIVGTSIFIGTAHLLDRRKMLIGTFFALSLLLAITAGVFQQLFLNGSVGGIVVPGRHMALIFLWALIQTFFAFGPNTLTFIIPAEVFPTRYRCTGYGIAAASGKLGAVVVQIVSLTSKTDGPNDPTTLKWSLAAFSICMAFGGLVALFPQCIPAVQHNDLENKSLEELSDDKDFGMAKKTG